MKISKYILQFQINNPPEKDVKFIETTNVKPGVTCDVYKSVNDDKKDLGIITIAAGCKTPLQKVLSGDKTIEGHLSGMGILKVTNNLGETKTYYVSNNLSEPFSMEVDKGEVMQWEADKNSELIVYEICFPPYKDGRFQNLE